jgi:hypothetical protein
MYFYGFWVAYIMGNRVEICLFPCLYLPWEVQGGDILVSTSYLLRYLLPNYMFCDIFPVISLSHLPHVRAVLGKRQINAWVNRASHVCIVANLGPYVIDSEMQIYIFGLMAGVIGSSHRV